MPKRTNDFQELVAMIQRALAPKGAKITESALVEVPGLSTLREVDILMEGPFAPFVIKVACETKDERRKLSLPTFDSLLGKYFSHSPVQVDRLVIVTRKGFTNGVVEKAKSIPSIELLTLDEAAEKDWSTEGPGALHFHVAPHISNISSEPPIEGISDKELMTSGRLACSCCMRDCGSIMEYATKQVFHHILSKSPEIVRQLDDRAAAEPSGQAIATISWDVHDRTVVVGTSGYPISRIAVTLHAINSRGELKGSKFGLSDLDGQSKEIAFFQGKAGGKSFRFVLPTTDSPNPLVMRIDSAANNERPKTRRNDKCPCGSGKKFKSCCAKANPRGR